MDEFVDFLVTKHGLASALRSDQSGLQVLHVHFLDRLLRACADLVATAAEASEIHAGVDAYQLMHGVGNLCIGADTHDRYDARPWSRSYSPACA
jgi:hypothetical protein